MQSPTQILQQYWGHASFRGEQEAIINSILNGKDTLALLPTGGGKSVCFQVPALMNDGLCIVISPLIALMRDQVDNLLAKNIPATCIYSGMGFNEVKKVLQSAAQGQYKFLYLSPERLETRLFKEYVGALGITLIAVDEAHCISQWGYDFRPPYLRIANLRKELPNVPVIALTASATPLVQKDIADKLLFKDFNVFKQSFERSNLSLSVFHVDSKINKVVDILNSVSGSGIVYCRNRRRTKEVAQMLQLHQIVADNYHAGLLQDERVQKQKDWIENKTRIIVCTNAFGMGIDKPDVRCVIHYDVPDQMEYYYQEAGRAGRDGKQSFAVLLYQTQDVKDLETLPDIRFPKMTEIKKVYQALADHLQIPVGLGEGNYYDFDLNTFVTNFKLDIFLVMNVLKVLEQEGHLSFNESVFLPAKVQCTADKDILNNIENTHPQFDALVKCLLRTYTGIYDNSVMVHEKQLARLLRTTVEEVKQQLQRLQAFGLIEYSPQKETPQIYFILNRAPASSLHIDQDKYQYRKKLYSERVEEMLHYVSIEKGCRSRFIATYFGDKTAKDCGTCDNCLKKKASVLSEEEFKKIEATIYAHINSDGILMEDLLQKMNGIKKEKFWKVMEFLQNERKLTVDSNGNVCRI
jgi:ATP-dependent DNA helicase RecQ